jgi:hypothetical protein
MGSEDLVERRIGLFQSEQGLEEWRDLRQRIKCKDRSKSMSRKFSKSQIPVPMAWVMVEEQDPSNGSIQQTPGANGVGVVVLNQ